MDPNELGLKLAADLKWNGDRILEAAYAALVDANFHEQAQVIHDLMVYGY
jgi:hypothetical protein